MQTQKNFGFSLIELMVVVALIAVLAIIAIPAYTNYIDKAHLSEIFSSIKQDQDNVVTYISTNNIPASALDATNMLSRINGLTVCDSSYVSTAVGDCTFTAYGIHVVTNSTLLPSITLDFTPKEVGKLIQWTCTYEAASSADGLTILPIMCKQLNTTVTTLW